MLQVVKPHLASGGQVSQHSAQLPAATFQHFVPLRPANP